MPAKGRAHGRTGTPMGRVINTRRRKYWTDPGVPKAGPVTITRADGSVEVQPALSRKEAAKLVRRGARRK